MISAVATFLAERSGVAVNVQARAGSDVQERRTVTVRRRRLNVMEVSLFK
jgi:hypothetical protein